MYGRWYTVKYGEGSRRQYIKLHALISADTDMPFFLVATPTPSNASDTKQLEPMIDMLNMSIKEMYLDKGYLSRINAQLIADMGAVPYIAIKNNIKSRSFGYPAWYDMVSRWIMTATMSTITGGA
ncbi:MAG: transposase [Nitrososphaeria archaeon]